MSDPVKHECAVALLRLLKPQHYYQSKYGLADYGFQKMALLLEKQHNRGQDGAGIAALRIDPQPGTPAYSIQKSAAADNPLAELLGRCAGNPAMNAEIMLGHLRYATYGRHDLAACHPFVHESSCLRRTLLLAGNFNLTSARTLFDRFLQQGHHPASKADGYLLLQTIAHYLEQDSSRHPGPPDWPGLLHKALGDVDGAFTLCGLNGAGDTFVIRDPHGIRPGYYYYNGEVFVAASERPAIQAAFDCSTGEVQEIPRGKALILHRSGELELADCLEPQEERACVFERIYFSRPNDADIHRERRRLGECLTPAVLNATGRDWSNTFFSYIPNSAQVSFHGLLEEVMKQALPENHPVRFGQIAVKDAKFRTFIADSNIRKSLNMHVYDVTYGLVHPGTDTLVVLDDSIVRGNTMRNAILPILDRLEPQRIVVASSAPPIKYPDCYGIDMAVASDLVAFQAIVSILRESGRSQIITAAYEHAKADLALPPEQAQNRMKELYAAASDEELAARIARLLAPPGLKASLTVIFQTVDDLHRCCPAHRGDWYFTGDYPTPGGVRTANQALINFVEHSTERAY